MTVKLKPTPLPTNQPTQFYRGGSAIAALRGETRREYGPEDWVASTTTRFGEPESGLSVLPGGELLISAVQADPLGWLGTDHVAAFGASTALLVKLLDAGQRLPVHCHPSDHFAQCHFHSPIGKTEAWIVIGTGESDATVHAGFHTAVELDTAAAWVRNQDRCAMLGSLNRLDVAVGDTVFIPAGLPHSIGAGVFVVELQQPTDFSITLEWQDFLADEAAGHLGIGFDKALLALDRSAWPAQRLDTIVRRGSPADVGSAQRSLLPDAAAEFFRADTLRPGSGFILPAEFAVLLTLSGSATLRTENGAQLALSKGSTVVVPAAAGYGELTGDAEIIRARPPLPPHLRGQG